MHVILSRFFAHAGIDKEIDSVWQKLTPLEQKEFEEAVKTGRIGHLIAVYTPWWEVSWSDNGVHVYVAISQLQLRFDEREREREGEGEGEGDRYM